MHFYYLASSQEIHPFNSSSLGKAGDSLHTNFTSPLVHSYRRKHATFTHYPCRNTQNSQRTRNQSYSPRGFKAPESPPLKDVPLFHHSPLVHSCGTGRKPQDLRDSEQFVGLCPLQYLLGFLHTDDNMDHIYFHKSDIQDEHIPIKPPRSQVSQRHRTLQGRERQKSHFTLESTVKQCNSRGTAKCLLCSTELKKSPLQAWLCCKPTKEK